MQQDVIIRRLEKRDEEAALRLLVSKVPAAQRDRAAAERQARWRWQYYENPSNPESTPILWVADSAGTIAGLVCPLAVRLRTPKGLAGASWCNDWIVDPAFRGTGLGWTLEEAWVKTFPIALGRGWSERAYEVSVKLGLVTVSGFWRYWIVLSRVGFARLLLAAKHHRRLARLAQTAPAIGLSQRPVPGYSIEISSELPAGIDSLWQQVSSGYAFAVERDLKHMKWRYQRHPAQQYQFVTAVAGKDLAGLVVVRLSEDHPRVGVLCDVLVDPSNKNLTTYLVEGALRLLKHSGACAAVVDLPPRLAAAFAAIRRPIIKEDLKILVSDNVKAYGELGIFDASAWYLSKSDSDIDFSGSVLA
jgi:GNAT superfamily N-acetyltransferase